MIYWYSGTGNSRYAAERIAQLTGDTELRFIPSELGIKPYDSTKVFDSSNDSDTIGFVFPVYSWGVPPVVLQMIERLDASNLKSKYLWAVLTCGDEAGRAAEMLCKAFQRKRLTLSAVFTLIMPNNYVMLPGFSTDSTELASNKIHAAKERLTHIAEAIKKKEVITDIHHGPWPRLKTCLVYPLFKHFGVQTKRWRVDTVKCISCGKCAATCPAANISLTDGHPKWSKICFSCTACYHVCPRRAIDYGRFTKGKPQYFFKELTEE